MQKDNAYIWLYPAVPIFQDLPFGFVALRFDVMFCFDSPTRNKESVISGFNHPKISQVKTNHINIIIHDPNESEILFRYVQSSQV